LPLLAPFELRHHALNRYVQDLEDELVVDLLRRGPRGVTLTAEGKLFLEEARKLLRRADESVEKVRALARGEYGELRIGYAAVLTADIMPPALAPFRKAVLRVKLLLHDLASMNRSPGCATPRWNWPLWSSPPASRGWASN
jgi:DNA-binding transcriptional LysR family regulator